MRIPIPAFVAGTFLLLASQMFAQSTGQAHPEVLDDSITVNAPQAKTVVIAEQPQPAVGERVVEERVIETRVAAAPAVKSAPAVRTAPAQAPHPVLYAPVEDPADAGIVTTAPYSETELLEGTLFKARLNERLSTVSTKPGTRFTARVSENVEHGGMVVFPAGAILSGRVTEVRGGHRVHGAAALHLLPEIVTLPDGSFYRLSAQVADLDQHNNARVNSEGTILRKDHMKRTLAEVGLTTGSAAVAGAVLAGAPGAAVGAGIGVGVGAIWWLKQDRQQTLAEGTEIVFSLSRPMELTPLANQAAR